MNPVQVFFYKLLLQAGIPEPYEAALNTALVQESPLSELVLDLSTCMSNVNQTISLLHQYTMQFDVDLSQVADMVWEYLHDQYCNKKRPISELRYVMYRIAGCLDDWFEEPWYTMHVFELLWDDVKAGLISEDDLLHMMDDFLMSKKTIGNFNTGGNPMEAMHNLLNRRSVRKYTDQQVPDDLLDKILEAGLYAPTGMNTQNIYMVAVRDKETRDQMMGLNAAVMGSQNDPFYGAPCVIVVLGDASGYPVVENGSLVLGNLMNAAHAVGLGSCWIHRAKQTFETEEGKALLRKWGLPDTLVGIGNCILGYPAEDPVARPRKDGRIVKV